MSKKPFDVIFEKDTTSSNPKEHYNKVYIVSLNDSVPDKDPDYKHTSSYSTISWYYFKEMKVFTPSNHRIPNDSLGHLVICPITKNLLYTTHNKLGDFGAALTYCELPVQEAYKRWLADKAFERDLLWR